MVIVNIHNCKNVRKKKVAIMGLMEYKKDA